MSSTTLYKHHIWCISENSFATVWKENMTALTACPNNTTHTVQAGSWGIIDIQQRNIVEVNKETAFRTSGRAKVDSIMLTIPAGQTLSITKTWPIDIAIYKLIIPITSDLVGCLVTTEVAPLTTVGTLTADAGSGSTILSVSPSATMAFVVGQILTLTQGPTTEELGRVLAIDTLGNQITVETPTVSAFMAGAVVKLTTRASSSLPLILGGQHLRFGDGMTRATGIQKGWPLVFTVANPNMSAANFTIYVTYTY